MGESGIGPTPGDDVDVAGRFALAAESFSRTGRP